MQVLGTVLLAVQMLSAIVMIGLILVQHGKGADMGAAFGSGASGSLFGASGSANFMSRATGILAAVFFVCTLTLAYFSGVRPTGGSGSVLEKAGIAAPAGSASAPVSAPMSAPASGPAAIPTGSGAAPTPASTPATSPVSTPAVAASGAAAPVPTK